MKIVLHAMYNMYATDVRINMNFPKNEIRVTGNIETNGNKTPFAPFTDNLANVSDFINPFKTIATAYLKAMYNAENTATGSNASMTAQDIAFRDFWIDLFNGIGFNLSSINPVFNIELKTLALNANGNTLFNGAIETYLPFYLSSHGNELDTIIGNLEPGAEKTKWQNKKSANQTFFDALEPILTDFMPTVLT